MTFLLDFTQIPLQRTGVGVYADHLLRTLPSLMEPGERLIVLVQSDDLGALAVARSAGAAIHVVTIPAAVFRRRAALLLFEQAVLPLLLLRHRVHVVHSLHYTHPLWAPCARAVTIHDLTFSLFPELHTRGRRWLFPWFTRRVMRRAEAPLFVSHATQKDATRLFGPSRYPGSVTPLGVSAPTSTSPQSFSAVLAEHNIDGPFVLFLGTLEPRKNLLRVLAAFAQLAEQHPQHLLVLAGKIGWHSAEITAALHESPVRNRVRIPGFVPEHEKAALLSCCDALLYPSLYEGFGLPVLEALACGAPVITSNLSSMPEVAGDAALLVDPLSVKAIAVTLHQVLSDAALAAALRTAGPARAAQFPWRATAERTLAAYRAAAERG